MVNDLFLPERVGGSEVYTYEISKVLTARGYRIHILTGTGDRSLPKRETKDGLLIHRYYVMARNIFLLAISSILQTYRLFKELIQETSFDTIIFHHPFPAIGILGSGHLKEKKKIYVFYGPIHQEWACQFHKTKGSSTRELLKPIAIPILSLILEKMQRYVLRHVDKVLVLSKYSRDQVNTIFNVSLKKAEVIPGGVNTTRFSPASGDKYTIRDKLNIPHNKIVLLTIRRLTPRMGLENLIKAMSLVSRQNKDVVLLIGGKGSLEADLKKLVNELKLNGHIHFLGFIDDEKLPLYYRASDFFILPTIDLEGFGLVTLEALSSGTPVLGTPIGSTPEILGRLDRNLLFSSPDAVDISNKIVGYMSRPEEIRRLRKKSRKFVLQNYSWQISASKLEGMFLDSSK